MKAISKGKEVELYWEVDSITLGKPVIALTDDNYWWAILYPRSKNLFFWEMYNPEICSGEELLILEKAKECCESLLKIYGVCY
jgi:hypothetical protein